MINIEPLWIAEVVQVSLNDYLVLELFDKSYNLMQNPFISSYENSDECVYCVFRSYQDSIDDIRKAVALNMSELDLKEEHPEHSFLIKPYINATLIGSIHDSKFTSGVQKFNIGIHKRFSITSTETINILFNNSIILDSLLNLILNNQFIKSQIKPICSLFLSYNPDQESKFSLLKHLSRLLRDDYFLLKEISNYLQ